MAAAKTKYLVNRLKESDLDCPWLSSSNKDYKNRTALIKIKMEADYQPMADMISALLNKIGESKQIRRLMPKNEWVLAYAIQVIVQNQPHHYLLIVGAEVNTKQKSMGYADGQDHYSFQNCYFVLGSKELLKAEKFGTSINTRYVKGHAFHEYDFIHTGVRELALRLLKIVTSREKV